MILSKLKQTLLGATIVISSLVMQVNAQSSSPRRITVDPSSTTNSGTSFSTIKMAVDSARNGDTVLVSEGTYKEKVFFNSNYSNKKLVLGSLYLIDGLTSHITNTIISGAGVAQNNANTDNLFRVAGNNRDSTYVYKVVYIYTFTIYNIIIIVSTYAFTSEGKRQQDHYYNSCVKIFLRP